MASLTANKRQYEWGCLEVGGVCFSYDLMLSALQLLSAVAVAVPIAIDGQDSTARRFSLSVQTSLSLRDGYFDARTSICLIKQTLTPFPFPTVGEEVNCVCQDLRLTVVSGPEDTDPFFRLLTVFALFRFIVRLVRRKQEAKDLRRTYVRTYVLLQS